MATISENQVPLVTIRRRQENHNSDHGVEPLNGALMLRIAFFFVCLFVGVIVLIVRNSGTTRTQNSYYDTDSFNVPKYIKSDYSWEIESCHTFECQNAVKDILSSLNTSVDPCENFYEYACEGWQANNPRPSYSPEWTVFSKLEKKTSQVVSEILSKSIFDRFNRFPKYSDDLPALKLARNFYQDCMGYSTKPKTYLKPATQSRKRDLRVNNILHQFDQYNFSLNDNSNIDLKTETTPTKPFTLQKAAKLTYSKGNLDLEDNIIYDIMLNTLNKHGGWPLLQDQNIWNNSKFDLIKSMIAMKQQFASPIFIDVISIQDPFKRLENNSIYVSRPSQSGTLINIIEQADKQKFKTIYLLRDFIVNISKELLKFQGNTKINETYLEEKAFEIITVEGHLQLAADQKIDPIFKYFNRLTQPFLKTNVSHLQNLIDDYSYPLNNSLKISDLILQLYYPIFTNGVVSRPIKVANIDYVLSVSKLLNQLKPEVLANYIMFKMVSAMIPFSTQSMRDHFTNFKNSLGGTKGEIPRKKFCADLTQNKFQLVVGQAYIQQRVFNHFETVKEMFKGIKQVFVDLVTSSNIPYLNKTILLAELEYTGLCLGYPYYLSDKQRVESEYNGLSLHQSTFLEKLMVVNTWLTKKQLSTINKQPDLKDDCKWSRFAGTIGAFNQLPDFLVYLPLGMLQSPYYNVGLPKAINYGTLGSILGHEIVHGLVGSGWTEFKNGSLTPVSECLVNQYENFSTADLKEKNITLNGMLTLQENIPDNVGLLGAFKAFKKEISKTLQWPYVVKDSKRPVQLAEFTDEQSFFIGFAQNWCQLNTPESFQKTVENDAHGPGQFRVLGSLQNSKEFSQTWNCPIGSKMNPDPANEHKKCKFF